MPKYLGILALCVCLNAIAFAQSSEQTSPDLANPNLASSQGRIFYKSTPSDPITSPLPEIKKENFMERLQEIKRSTPNTCNNHQGIDCEKGQDPQDGSVICNDGFRDSKESFSEFCTQTRLQLISETFLDKNEQEIPKELRKPKTFGGTIPAKIIIKLRNLSGIKARQVKVEGEIVKRKFSANGPFDIEPFSLEEYILTLDESSLPIFPDFRRKYQTLISCQNCLSSRRTLQ